MADQNWYYSSGGQQVGPISQTDLQARIAAGQLSPQDHVWRDGMAQWQPLFTVPELQGQPGQATPQGYPQQYGPAAGYGYQQPVGYGGYPQGMVRPGAQNGKAITAFVLALIGLIVGNILLGPIGIILAAVALGGMKGGDTKGKGLAIAAIVIGVLDIIEFFVVYQYIQQHPEVMRQFGL